MFCSPASSNNATNGVVFHTSASTSGTQAARSSANHVGAAIPSWTRPADARPPGDSNMKRHTSPATTVGIAHGRTTTSTNERPRANHSIEQQRQREAGGQFERHACPGKKCGVSKCAPEPAIGHELEIVVPTDEWPAEPGHAQIVEVQRLPECPGNRKHRHERDDRECREGKQPTQPAFAKATAFGGD